MRLIIKRMARYLRLAKATEQPQRDMRCAEAGGRELRMMREDQDIFHSHVVQHSAVTGRATVLPRMVQSLSGTLCQVSRELRFSLGGPCVRSARSMWP